MDIYLIVALGVLAFCLLVILLEYRVRRPDVLVLYESRDRIGLRKGLIYPRHFSLPLKRTTCPFQFMVEATTAGNLGVRIKIVGSVAPSLEHISSLIRVGGWDFDAVVHATNEVQILIQGLVKEYSEHSEISSLSSSSILNYLNDRASLVEEKFGVEVISLAIQSLDPVDPAIADVFRQQEEARLLEQTEQLNHMARVAAAKSRYRADEEIAKMEHALELKKARLNVELLEKESALAHQRLEDELERSRLRLAFEKEELEVLKNSPELLVLTPQAARLAEASQNLKNARTVVSIAPQELLSNSEFLSLFQNLLKKAQESKEKS